MPSTFKKEELPDQSNLDMTHEHTRIFALAERWMVRARNAEAELTALRTVTETD